MKYLFIIARFLLGFSTGWTITSFVLGNDSWKLGLSLFMIAVFIELVFIIPNNNEHQDNS